MGWIQNIAKRIGCAARTVARLLWRGEIPVHTKPLFSSYGLPIWLGGNIKSGRRSLFVHIDNCVPMSEINTQELHKMIWIILERDARDEIITASKVKAMFSIRVGNDDHPFSTTWEYRTVGIEDREKFHHRFYDMGYRVLKKFEIPPQFTKLGNLKLCALELRWSPRALDRGRDRSGAFI